MWRYRNVDPTHWSYKWVPLMGGFKNNTLEYLKQRMMELEAECPEREFKIVERSRRPKMPWDRNKKNN